MKMLNCLLLDLDDTIFDHKHSRLCALSFLKESDDRISSIPIGDLETEHEVLLQGNYRQVLDGKISMNDSIVERTHQLFHHFGFELSRSEAVRFAEMYHRIYERNKRAVPGVSELLSRLPGSCCVGVVSNGLSAVQWDKLKVCKVEDTIDFMIVSDDVGARKPDRVIFEAALNRAGVTKDKALFIGDSWESDIVGAANCGIRPMWLNRYGKKCPDPGMAEEINSFDDVEALLRMIIGEPD